MRSMLLAAQKMAASMTEEAKTKSEQLLSDAQQESRRLLEEAKNSAEVINRDLAWKTKDAREKYEQAKAAMEDFVAKNLALCLQQAEYLEKLPHSRLTAPEEPAAAPAEVPAEEPVSVSEPAPAAEPAAQEDVMKQDTVRIIEKDILAAYDEQTEKAEKAEKAEKPEPLPADTDFRSEFKLDLDELKFGRNYDPNK